MRVTAHDDAPRIAQSAEVHPSATVGPRTRVEAYAVLQAGVVVGADCVIGRGAELEENAQVGDRTRVWGHAYLGSGARVGNDCTVARNVYVGRGVAVGDACKLEDHVQLSPGIVIGDRVFVGPFAMFCNDNEPAAVREPDNPFVAKTTIVHDDAVICAGAVITAERTIGAASKVWPNATVTYDVPAESGARSVPATMHPRKRRK